MTDTYIAGVSFIGFFVAVLREPFTGAESCRVLDVEAAFAVVSRPVAMIGVAGGCGSAADGPVEGSGEKVVVARAGGREELY